jgi:hypothetical protein
VRRRSALPCVATIAAADYVIKRRHPPWLVIGLLDEPAHLATALLLGGRDPVFLVGALLPDLDHVPLVFRDPARGDPRPKTHSIWAAALGAMVSRRLAAGMLAHLARDLALEPGVPLFGRRHFRVPYAAYALAMTAMALRRPAPRL